MPAAEWRKAGQFCKLVSAAVPAQNFGLAVGDFVKAPAGLYKPTALSINGWLDDYTEVRQLAPFKGVRLYTHLRMCKGCAHYLNFFKGYTCRARD